MGKICANITSVLTLFCVGMPNTLVAPLNIYAHILLVDGFLLYHKSFWHLKLDMFEFVNEPYL